MYPPSWVLEKCQQVMPNLRIGWLGAERTDPDDLNAGKFILLELRRTREQIEKQSAIGIPWENKGPIYGDYFDPLLDVPIWIIDVSKEDVFSGRVIDLVKRWTTPFKQRVMADKEEEWKAYNETVSDMTAEAGDYINATSRWDHEGGTPIMPNKAITSEEKSILSGEAAAQLKEQSFDRAMAMPTEGVTMA